VDWPVLALLCAFCAAAADAATKAWLSEQTARELVLVRFTLTGLLLLPLIFSEPLPSLPWEFWGWVALLLPAEILAMWLYVRAIRDHPLSLTLPYLAFTPVIVVVTGFLILGERIDLRGFAGILLVVMGAWLLNQHHAQLRAWKTWIRPLTMALHEPGARMMLGVAALYSLTSVLGKGALAYLPPEQFGPFYFFLLGLASLLVFRLPPGDLVRLVRRRPVGTFGVAALMAAMVVTHFLAIAQVEVAYMIALKRTSLLFGILFGVLIFRERQPGLRFLAATLMLAGVALIVLPPGVP